MKYKLFIEAVVRDRNGKVIARERRRSRSLVKQWNQMVYCQLADAGTTIKDTGGVDRAGVESANNFVMNAPAGTTTYGLRVGTGNTAVILADYAVETPIAHGTAAGQLNHLVCSVAQSVTAAPSCYFIVQRVFANYSGGSITVREAAIYTKMVTWFACVARDVFGTELAVPDGGSITITWTLQVTV